MLKYIKNHMATIGGIEIYPIISFLIFFTFFVVVAIWVMKANKEYLTKMSELPLEKDNLSGSVKE
ncbi:MAG: CcoQ/FixQ family Cbb3-type cytochrome c oxidase assembly chaperone [Cytophagaceae bacterium]|nr:CcoQ/FixQ family Cbb3-type cytochrome c oxidase assembly chaperone [Cytophagaceae bacterium]